MESYKVNIARMTMMTLWCVWACGLNSLLGSLNVETHDIWEVNVTIENDILIQHICSLWFWNVREGWHYRVCILNPHEIGYLEDAHLSIIKRKPTPSHGWRQRHLGMGKNYGIKGHDHVIMRVLDSHLNDVPLTWSTEICVPLRSGPNASSNIS